MIFRPPRDDPLSPANAPDRYCRTCLRHAAVPLPELGEPWGRYELFCSVNDAAIYGVVAALEKEIPPPQPDAPTT